MGYREIEDGRRSHPLPKYKVDFYSLILKSGPAVVLRRLSFAVFTARQRPTDELEVTIRTAHRRCASQSPQSPNTEIWQKPRGQHARRMDLLPRYASSALDPSSGEQSGVVLLMTSNTVRNGALARLRPCDVGVPRD